MAKKEVKKGNTKNSTKNSNVEKKINTPKKNTNIKKEDISKKEKPEVKELKEEKIVEKKEEVKKEVVKKESKFDKKILYIIGGVLIIIVLIFVIVKCVNNPKAKTTKSVKEMGEAFYTEYYYKELSKGKSNKELSNILSKFKDKGIKISINNLSLYKSGVYKEKIESMKKDFKCDGKNTKVIIYPKSPYGKNDYKIETELQCKF